MIKVTLVRSQIGIKPKQRGTIRALGLGKIGSTNTLPDRPEVRGMIHACPAPREGGGSFMKLHDLKPTPGSKRPEAARRPRHRRQGRQDRGPRPQGSRRPRHRCPRGFEGGQTPLHRRTPKAKGFNNPFRIEYHVVNLSTLELFDSGSEVSPDTLRSRGLVAKQGLVKVLARGELSKPLTVRAHAFSAAAVRAIEAAGGTTEVLPLPWRTGRPPARGNAHTNR